MFLASYADASPDDDDAEYERKKRACFCGEPKALLANACSFHIKNPGYPETRPRSTPRDTSTSSTISAASSVSLTSHPTSSRPTSSRPTSSRPTSSRPTSSRPTSPRPTSIFKQPASTHRHTVTDPCSRAARAPLSRGPVPVRPNTFSTAPPRLQASPSLQPQSRDRAPLVAFTKFPSVGAGAGAGAGADADADADADVGFATADPSTGIIEAAVAPTPSADTFPAASTASAATVAAAKRDVCDCAGPIQPEPHALFCNQCACRVCSNCQSAVQMTDKFCYFCRFKLKEVDFSQLATHD